MLKLNIMKCVLSYGPSIKEAQNKCFNISVGRVGRQDSFQLKLEIGLSLATSKVIFLYQIAIALYYTKDISGKLCEIGRGKIVIFVSLTLGYIKHQVNNTLSVQHHTMCYVNAFIYRFICRCITKG